MLKHLPEGLTPFEDCGFARHPYLPLAFENVYVDCRVDKEDGVPELFLQLNCVPVQRVEALCIREDHYRFDLGSFQTGDQVRYQIVTKAEKTCWYSFEVLLQKTYSKPKNLMITDDKAYAVFEGFTVCFETGDKLKIVVEKGERQEGKETERITLKAPMGFQLNLKKRVPFCELKRFSNVVFSIASYTLCCSSTGSIRHLSQTGDLHVSYIWGTGERFDHINQQGHGSNGRVVEKFTQQGDQTYLPMPFWMTEKGFGLYRDSVIPAPMCFHDGYSISQFTQGSLLSCDVLFFGTPAALLSQFLSLTGKPVLPPEWAFGVWISANGWNCDSEVDAQLEAMRQNDYPADVMVLEAWSDEQTFHRWNDKAHWADPAAMVQRVRENGLHLVLWQIPIIKYEWDGETRKELEEDIREAVAKRYCVMNEDGSPYRITENWFHHSLLMDFTNPDALRWWFNKRKYLLDMGVEGFKTDGGEFLFDHSARLYNGMTGLEAHNCYPSQYIGAYHDFMKQNGIEGVTFSRADYTGAHTRPIHWAGDQLSFWSELQSQLRAGITAGLSGILFWGFDIGGFAGELPSAQLYLRATAMACFSPVMQWHAEPRYGQFYATHGEGFNNDRSPWNLAQKLNDERVLSIAAAFARLRRELRSSLYEEAAYCVQHCRPMMAHLCIDFPEDARAIACEDEYMLGRRWLVAPIVSEDVWERKVYLPAGNWRHFFTHEVYEGKQTIQVVCPLEQIPVFERLDRIE